MIDHDYLYEQACEDGDTARYVRGLTDHELRLLRKKAEHLQTRNGCKGGIPALIKWLCVIEQAERMQGKVSSEQ